MWLLNRAKLLVRTDRNVFLGVVILGLIILVDAMLLVADYSERRSLVGKKQELRTQISHLAALGMSIDNASAVLGKSRQIKAAASQLAHPVSQPDIVSTVFQLAGQTGIHVRDQNFVAPEQVENGFEALAQTLEVTGTYRQVRGFLKAVEQNEQGITVIERSELASDESGNVRARLKLVTYGGAAVDE